AHNLTTKCIPANNLSIPANNLIQTGISKDEFDLILNKIEQVYTPIVTNLGAKLRVNRRWDDNAVDANAMRFGTTWVVNMYGGMARHRLMDVEGMTMIACHEIGHHVGGFPRDSWYSGEGQADYYGALKCLRKVWANDDNLSIVAKLPVPSSVGQKCLSQFKTQADVAICMRGAMANLSMARVLAELRGESTPDFETPSKTVVTATVLGHTHSQCRLDTGYAGSLCSVDQTIDVSDADPNVGVCSRKAGISVGVRPLCWYRE
ncbi:MAG: hypothetical protein A4S09_03175, partial [Proteobacteria bacterium SG_bin7]